MSEILRKVPLFAELSAPDLARLAELATEVRLAEGELLFDEGSTGTSLYVVVDGRLRVVKQAAGREVLLAVRGPGDILGEMAVLEEQPRMAAVRAECASSLIAIAQEHIEALLAKSPAAARALLHTVVGRWRTTESMLRQSEKMAQIGTLSAGLAHELNNPAAAVQRASAQLRDAQVELDAAARALPDAARAALAGVPARAPAELEPLARADREEALEAWLGAHAVAEPWNLAPALVRLGWDATSVAELSARVTTEHVGVAVRWLGATQAVQGLLAELHEGASRIAELVKALKGYAYLDRAPVLTVDVHEGLDNTLVLLRRKLQDGVLVRREYAPDLPRILAWASELNQVWTNLIDNAADAMHGRGELVVRTHAEDAWVVVEVIDDGPGIPPDVLPRIFDAFFTTKPQGQGTGLGLDIAHNIVVNRHRGELRVRSRPGRTVFEVRLPVNFEQPTATPAAARLSDDALRALLSSARRIAVVGASDRADAPAHKVPAYLQAHGYTVLPVNPTHRELLGVPAYPSLAAVPAPIDVVLVFRRAEEVPAIVDAAIAAGAHSVWMQEGIVHEAAAATARDAGLAVVMDTCIRATHQRLI